MSESERMFSRTSITAYCLLLAYFLSVDVRKGGAYTVVVRTLVVHGQVRFLIAVGHCRLPRISEGGMGASERRAVWRAAQERA